MINTSLLENANKKARILHNNKINNVSDKVKKTTTIRTTKELMKMGGGG